MSPSLREQGIGAPDGPFHNFRATISVDQRVLWSAETWIGGFRGTGMVEGSVGRARML